MKRVIRLTERDLTRIVKRTIMELDKSTYEKAADVAGERGFSSLSDRFREHGQEFGLVPDRDTITMVIDFGSRKGIETRKYRIKNIEEENFTKSYKMNVQDLDSNKNDSFYISKMGNKLVFYLNEDYDSLPKTRKDAKRIIQEFESEGSDFAKEIDPRMISYDYVGFQK